MAGHIAGLGYSQRMDVNGDPLAGAKLYVYSAGTSTPATVYEDYALSIEHSFPIVADAAGIIPMFWVADGTYRVRLTDASGNEIFDDDGVVAIGPSSGSGGGGATTPEAAIFQTGDMMWKPVSGTRTGWVRSNGRTIGSSASGATERAAADTEELFVYLWNNFSDSLCPVSGGRGLNASTDFNANKAIATLDMRDRGPWGLSDMGNTSTGTLGTTPGEAGGSSSFTLDQTNLPNVNFSHSLAAATHTHNVSGNTGNASVSHTHVGTTTTDGAHTHTTNNAGNTVNVDSPGGTPVSGTDGDTTSSNGSHNHTFTTNPESNSHIHAFSVTSEASGSLSVSGTVSSGGSATAVDKMPPYRLGSWYQKL